MMIQKLRLQRGWSQQQLADLSGLSVRTIQRMEQGQAASNESLKSLAAVFEVDFLTLKEPSMAIAPDTLTDNAFQTAPQVSNMSPEEVLALSHVRKLKGFYFHLSQYVVIIGALAVFNWVFHPQHIWAIWPALGWGLGVFMHATRVFDGLNPWGAQWEKNQVEKRLGRKL